MGKFQTIARGVGLAWVLFLNCSLVLLSQMAWRGFAWIEPEAEQERPAAETLSADSEADEIEAQILFDPGTRSIIGTAQLRFHSPAGARSFALDDDLTVAAALAPGAKVRLFRREHRVYLVGSSLQGVLVCFSGRLPPWDVQEKQRVGHAKAEAPSAGVDKFLTLQTDCLAFMPCSQLRFSRSRVTVYVPARFNCLGSGIRRELPGPPGIRAFSFDSIASRGFSLTCGDFQLLDRLEGTLPVNFFGSPQLDKNSYRDANKMRGAVDFFGNQFGRLDVPELNILLCRAGFQGGVSQPGCIVCFFNPDDAGKKLAELERLRQKSPVFLHDPRCDCLVHEIAHQWWGGLCSWSKRADCWITEGLAHFSTLLYLRSQLPENEFDPILERMGKWVERHEGAGKVTENIRLTLIQRDPLSAQAIVYNRSALILWMLRELLGEEEMAARLQRLLTERRSACWSTAAFIAWMAGNDPLLQDFFRSWVGRADLPAVRCRISGQGRSIRVAIEQVNDPFVFPLQFVSHSATGKQVRPLTVRREREEYIFLLSDSPPLQVGIIRGYTPVRVTLLSD